MSGLARERDRPFEDVLVVRSKVVNFHVVRDTKGLYLIDGGFIGGRTQLDRTLRLHGWHEDPILGILVTHGHLDHILNVRAIAEEHDSSIYAPRLDLKHYRGKPEYNGPAKVTGWLEAMGRPLLGFQPFTPDRLLDDRDQLDIWHGLSVINLPGHTAGHSGFYCAARKLLFCGDLFASFGRRSHLPPGILNQDSRQVSQSLAKALELELDGILPNHADQRSPQEHLQQLQMLARRR